MADGTFIEWRRAGGYMERKERSVANAGRGSAMTGMSQIAVSKVPEVTLGFWVIKILATTLGETGGDAVSMTLDLGYLVSSVLFLEVFAAAVAGQIAVRTFHPFLFWFVVITTTTAGTTLADFADRSLGIGYGGGVALLCTLLVLAFVVWYRVTGSLSVQRITTPEAELFYWVTILLSQTLGTALGDWVADDAGLGFRGAALVFSGGLVLVALAYVFTSVSRTALFWCAFVLTRPLGAALGDLLDKPAAEGGFDINRLTVSGLLLVVILICIVSLPQRPAQQSHA
jgi:uncharacterized membrane-anchored protein